MARFQLGWTLLYTSATGTLVKSTEEKTTEELVRENLEAQAEERESKRKATNCDIQFAEDVRREGRTVLHFHDLHILQLEAGERHPKPVSARSIAST
jgi:hypothetical protein